eukprot:5048-Heterococcus_DN1.PRE.8
MYESSKQQQQAAIASASSNSNKCVPSSPASAVSLAGACPGTGKSRWAAKLMSSPSCCSSAVSTRATVIAGEYNVSKTVGAIVCLNCLGDAAVSAAAAAMAHSIVQDTAAATAFVEPDKRSCLTSSIQQPWSCCCVRQAGAGRHSYT